MPRSSIALASLLAATLGACAHDPTPQARAPRPPGQAVTMDGGGKQVLRIFAPAESTWTLAEGTIHLKAPDGYVDIWLVRDAKSLEDAARHVPDAIASEFKGFKQTSSIPFTGGPGGRQGLRLGGSGVEADDNDPGTADVVVFQAGSRFFIACTHGETLRAGAQALMQTLVRTAVVP